MPAAAVVTISDSRSQGRAEDQSGPAAEAALKALGLEIASRRIVPDDAALIRQAVRDLLGRVAVIVTTGGTGLARRDVTPEALAPLIDRDIPGFGEIMRTGSFGKTPLSILSRGGAGLAGETLIVMLPGSPRAVADCLALVGPAIKHVLKILGPAPADCAAATNANA